MITTSWPRFTQLLSVRAPLNSNGDRGFVYIAESASGFVKVGFSLTPRLREQSLNSAQSQKDLASLFGVEVGRIEFIACIVDCTRNHERQIQGALGPELLGGEWFDGPVSRELVRNLRAEAGTPPVGLQNEGQRLLRVALSGRGKASKLAALLDCSPVQVCRWLVGVRPSTENRVALLGLLSIPVMAWDFEPNLQISLEVAA